jgi:hypothetical protein
MDPGIGNDAVSKPARAELWQTVLPILLEGEDGSMEVVGTGFVVLANGRQAHLVTAGHVCKEIQRRDRPLRSHPTALPDFIPTEYRVELRHARASHALNCTHGPHLSEPYRVCRRLVGLSYAAKAISCN